MNLDKLTYIWSNVLDLGVQRNMPFIKKRSIRNLNAVSISCSPFPIILSLLLLWVADVSPWVIILGIWSSVSILLVSVFNKFNKYYTGRLIMNISIALTLLLDAYLLGPGYGFELTFFVIVIGAFTFTEFSWEVKMYTALAFIGLLVCLIIYHPRNSASISHGNIIVHVAFGAASLISSIVCLSVLKSQSEDYEKTIEQANRELQLQKEELQNQHDNLQKLNSAIRDKNEKLGKKNFQITESLNYARRIQLSTLPDQQQLDKLLGENFVYYKPKDIVSGDFYWAHTVGDQTYLAVADCTGHGVPGAFMSMLGINTLRQILLESATKSPAQILSELDVRITTQLGGNNQEGTNREGMDISLCVFNKNNNLLRFSSAGRPVLLVRNCKVTEFKGSRAYIGKNYLQDIVFTNHEVELNQGDMIYLFTDGFTDQFDIEDKRKFSLSRLKNLLPEIFHVDVKAQQELIRHEFEKWKGHTPQTDDVLLLGYRKS